VRDLVRANLLAMERDEANYQVFNLGNGEGLSVYRIAELISEKLGSRLQPIVTGQYRRGDARPWLGGHLQSESTTCVGAGPVSRRRLCRPVPMAEGSA